MNSKFTIISVTREAYELSELENMGTRKKFWFEHQKLRRCLYKQTRPDTGEDWAEKITAELCGLLGLPHASYELAETWDGRFGVVSPYFLPPSASLIHGNEILAPLVPGYPEGQSYKVSQHTVDIVLSAIGSDKIHLPINWTAPVGIKTATDVFIGYLLLDAWIGNTDRHHENWAFVKYKSASNQTQTLHLAPTYDHSTSLGRELRDSARQKHLDKGTVQKYARRCRCAFYRNASDPKPLLALDAFHQAIQHSPEAAKVWLAKLSSISPESILNLLHCIPSARISSTAIEFAYSILMMNQSRLLELAVETETTLLSEVNG
jgi:hypothetical protein